jgi:hypothetical protein
MVVVTMFSNRKSGVIENWQPARTATHRSASSAMTPAGSNFGENWYE